MSILFTALTVLLAGGVLCLVLHHRCRVMRLLYILCTFAGSLLGLYALIVMVQHGAPASVTFSWLQVLHLSLALDSLSAAFLLPIFLLSPLIALYSHHYLAQPSTTWKVAVQYFFVSLLMASMALVAVADNMLTFALAWELMSVSSFVLVIYDHEKEESRRAGYLYLLFTQTGALFLFAAFGLLFASTGSLAFTGFDALPHGIKLTVFCLAMACFGSKAGVFPLHIWLPHAHPAAPSHVSALLSGVMIKMGVYGILRIYLLLEDPSPVFAYIVLICGLTSGVLGVAYALGKHDIKRLLAYHSIENIGIILTGAGLGMLGVSSGNRIMAAFGFAGCLLHVLNHALFKSLLFMGAGAVLQQTGTRHLDQLGGLMKTMPVTGWTFMTGSVAISGLPPLNGFISEFLIYYAAFQGLSHSGPVFLFSCSPSLPWRSSADWPRPVSPKSWEWFFLGNRETLQGGPPMNQDGPCR
jgi:hydrogenase-4 component B